MAYEVLALPYAYDSLERHIAAQMLPIQPDTLLHAHFELSNSSLS